jgi:hypothetical protein
MRFFHLNPSGAAHRGGSALRIGGGEAITRARAESLPRRRAAAALVALVLVGLPVGTSGNQIEMEDRGFTAPAEDAATGTEVKGLEFLATAEARGVNTKELLEDILLQLRCMASRQRFEENPAAGPGLGESVFSESELATLFEPPEVYRSGVDTERLRTLAAKIAGTDHSGNLDGSRATVKGLPPPLAVSGWGSPSTPLIAYIPRAETPFDLKPDMSGAGALVVDGDLNVWGSFHYTGLMVVLGDLAVIEDAELSIHGLPLFAGKLKVFRRGRFRVRARKAELTLIRKTLGGRVPLGHLPVPQIERVDAPTGEQDCAFFGLGM